MVEGQMISNAVSAADHERRMLDLQKKMLRVTRASYYTNIILAIALIAALVILIPKAQTMNDRVTTLMESIETSLEKINALSADAQTLIRNANSMIIDNTEAVTETVNKLNGVDFNVLNEAINNLNAAIKPLAEFAKLFQ